TVHVVSITGPTAVEGGAGNDTITVSNAAGTLAGIASLLAVDGGTGTNTLIVDDSGNTADSLGTLTQTSLTGLDMVGSGGVQVYSVTPVSPFTITLAGFGTTPTLAVGASAADVQEALQTLMFPNATCGTAGTSRCAQSAFVWQFGGDYLVGFQGEVAAAPPALTSTAVDLPRTDGINYYDIANLSIGLGSGNDRFNVRGTSAATYLNTGAGDDVVYVSDSANLGLLPSAAAAANGDLAAVQAVALYGTLTEDKLTFHGSLAEITGALTIDEGTGSNTLAISDRGDTSGRTALFTGTSIVGLAPAPITYGATGGDLAGEGYWTTQWDSGLFGHGIDVYGGSGGNTFTITGVYASDVTPSPFAETLTSIFTGEGSDNVGIDVAAGAARALAVDGQGGNDTIDGTGSTLPLVLFGGPGNDTITSGSANDILFGDTGRVVYLRPPGATGYDVVLGGPEIAAYQGAPVAADGNFLSPDAIYTDGAAGGGNDTITASDGNDLVFGGGGADGITVGNGNDVVFGDDGRVVPGQYETLDPGIGGNNTILAGNGNDVVFGGPGVDMITVGNGTDIVFGDDGLVTPVLAQTEDNGVGGNDTINSGSGNDVLFGGFGSDTIGDSGGHNIVLGDNGYVQWGVGELTAIVPTDPTLGAADTITITGAGSNYVIGGTGGDTITTGASDDLIFGDFGQIIGDIPLSLVVPTGPVPFTYTSVYTLNSDGGGNDVIRAGDGRNIVIGGQGNDLIISGSGPDDLIGGNNVPGGQDGSDAIDGGGGADVICGDNCSILPNGLSTNPIDRTLTAPTIYSQGPDGTYLPNVSTTPAIDPTGQLERNIVLFDGGTNDPTLYGNDMIAGGSGNDEIFGQMGNDTIHGDSGLVVVNNVAVGFRAELPTDTTTDGNDYIEGGGGNDLIYGDHGQDVIIGGSSNLFGYT
ncbi:MAG: hypothetical protein KGI93_06890, partial [Acidobacteriota bacterium]|nr:hypothetical protein [Acidobacteriota bacterium]